MNTLSTYSHVFYYYYFSEYLAHSVCLNKISQMDAVKEQIEYILAVLEKASSVDQSEFISYACW